MKKYTANSIYKIFIYLIIFAINISPLTYASEINSYRYFEKNTLKNCLSPPSTFDDDSSIKISTSHTRLVSFILTFIIVISLKLVFPGKLFGNIIDYTNLLPKKYHLYNPPPGTLDSLSFQEKWFNKMDSDSTSTGDDGLPNESDSEPDSSIAETKADTTETEKKRFN